MAQKIKGIVPPPVQMPEHLTHRGDFVQKKLPPLIFAFAVICIARAGVFLLFALIVGIAPDSEAGFAVETYFGPQLPNVSDEFVFLAGAAVYGLIGWRWMRRDWRIRWVAMFLTGATAARTMVMYFAERASGVMTPRTSAQQAELVISTFINLFLCCYLAFYPGIGDVFKETPWD
jgi:hypothetical protein